MAARVIADECELAGLDYGLRVRKDFEFDSSPVLDVLCVVPAGLERRAVERGIVADDGPWGSE